MPIKIITTPLGITFLVLGILCLVPDGLTMDTEITRRCLAAIVLGGLLLWQAIKFPQKVPGLLSCGCCLIWAVGLYWGLQGISPWYGIFENLLWICFLGAVLVFWQLPLEEEKFFKLFSGLSVLMFLLARILDNQWGFLSEPLSPSGINANTLAHFAALGGLAAIWGVMNGNPSTRLISGVMAIIFIPHLFFQDSKAALISFVFGLFALFWQKLQSPLQRGLIVVGLFVVLIVGVKGFGSSSHLLEQKSQRERAWMAMNAAILIAQSPWLGNGPGQFPATSLQISPKVTNWKPELHPGTIHVPLTPHSEPLGLVHDIGLPLFLLLCWWVLQQAGKRLKLLPFFIALLPLVLFDFPFHVTLLFPIIVMFLVARIGLEGGEVTPTFSDDKFFIPGRISMSVLGVALLVMGLAVFRVEFLLQSAKQTENLAALSPQKFPKLFGVYHPIAAQEYGTWLLLPEQEYISTASTPPYLQAVQVLEVALMGRATPKTLNHYGIALRRSGKPNQAAKQFQKALSLEVGYCDAWYNLGLALGDVPGNKGNQEDAFRKFRLCELGRGG